MPRKPLKPREKRPLPGPDYKFESVLVSRIINKRDVLDFGIKRIAGTGAENKREAEPFHFDRFACRVNREFSERG